MKKIIHPVLSALIVLACSRTGLQETLKDARWIDLTHTYNSSTVYWPTDEPFCHDTIFCGLTEKGYFYSSFKYSAEEHGGTHFDAPFHFHEGGKTIDQVPLSQLQGPGILISVTDSSSVNRDYLISEKDLQAWEKNHGRIPEEAIILLNTGYSKFWNDHLRYTGTLKKGKEGVAELHFPGLSKEAAQWLVSNRNPDAVGIDVPSIDCGQSKDFMTHRILTAAGITIYENLCQLDSIPAIGSYIVALPMKIGGGSGAPLRIVAILEANR
jgi:kynurenine formamidase